MDWTDPAAVADEVIRLALMEDSAADDAATDALGQSGARPARCSVRAREELVTAGIPLAARVFGAVSPRTGVEILCGEGERTAPGEVLAVISGQVSAILRGERVFLNILGRLCGIATMTARFVELVRGTGVEILDTRKTTPCLRALEKYAVRTGGGVNHRFSLADMAMIKDNHIAAAGGVEHLEPVMNRLRRLSIPVEIEVDSLRQLKRVLPLKPDRVLLDNMTADELVSAVRLASGTGIYLEASGGIDLDTVTAVAASGVDGISIGALTHSARSADIGLDWEYGGG